MLTSPVSAFLLHIVSVPLAAGAFDETALLQAALQGGFQSESELAPQKAFHGTVKDPAFVAECAQMSQDVYISGLKVNQELESLPGWKVKQALDRGAGLTGTDKMAIFQKGSNCVLAVSGIDQISDVIQTMLIVDPTTIFDTQCGTKIHAGFYNEYAKLTSRNKKWNSFKKVLKKCPKVYLTGHQLGGAVVSILAGCWAHGSDKSLTGIKIDGLYTFGAPGVSWTTMGTADDGCFEGGRFFNDDITKVDPLPETSAKILLRHPKVNAIGLGWSATKLKEYNCKNSLTSLMPPFIGKIPDLTMNLMSVYIKDVNNLLTQPFPYACMEGTRPDDDCCAKEGEGACAKGYTYKAGGGCGWFNKYTTTECYPSPGREISACLSQNTPDDCCTIAGWGSCDPGYTYVQGTGCSLTNIDQGITGIDLGVASLCIPN